MRTRIFMLILCGGAGVLSAQAIRSCTVQADVPSRTGAERARGTRLPTSAAEAPRPARIAGGAPSGKDTVDDDIVGTTDPRSTAYDPIKLAQLTSVSPMELWKKEPRDPSFAGPREVALEQRITQRLHKRVAFEPKVGASCRTSSCEVTIQGAKTWPELDSALQAIDLETISEMGMVGPMKSPDGASSMGLSIIIPFSAKLRDHDAYEPLLRRHRAQDESAPDPR